MNEIPRPVLAVDKVCHVGDTVAVIVSETVAQARDAADLLLVEYEPLPAVADTAAAVEPDAALVHPHLKTNLVFDIELADAKRTAEAFAPCRPRHAPPGGQQPHRAGANGTSCSDRKLSAGRRHLHALGAKSEIRTFCVSGSPTIRCVCPSTSCAWYRRTSAAGFGQKIFEYPEDAVVLWASKLLGRPVRWTGTRSENLLVDTYARDHVSQGAMAFDDDGRILALDIDTIASVGGYLNGMGAGICGAFYPVHLTGLYDIPAARCRIRGVYTNTTPTDAYRGAGQPEAAFLLERGCSILRRVK